jgi:hypothetical protein
MASTGANPRTTILAVQQVLPTSSARNACVLCDLVLAIGLRSAIEDAMPCAPRRCTGVGGAAFLRRKGHFADALAAVAVGRRGFWPTATSPSDVERRGAVDRPFAHASVGPHV